MAAGAEAGAPAGAGGAGPRQEAGAGSAGLDESAFAEAERRTAEACAALRQAPRPQDIGDPLYAVPWFLAVGDSRGFLDAACRNAPFARPILSDGAAAPLLSWWLAETWAAAAAAPARAPGRCLPPDGSGWRDLERLLAILVRHRPLRPLDGLLAFLPGETASRDPAAAAGLGRHVRSVADEWQRSVGFRLPVFLIVTGLDVLSGHQAVLSALPRDTADKALGVRLEAGLEPAARLAQLERGLAALEATLARLRLGLLLGGGEGTDRRGAFRFPVEFAALDRGPRAAAEALLAPDPAFRPALLRGVWFVATAGSGAHLDDLVHRLLPADAALCARA
ncbi:MAG: hypothetical protein GVY13_07950 [Alphaproteobacteria bacterium]|nr:hypothetical protein [Alphaproteobacteria bacterium]